MATLKGKAQQSTSIARQSEGNDVYLRALRDGSLIQSDWKQAAVMAGYGFMVNVGTFSSGVLGGESSIIDIDSPNYVLDIPNGTCIMPLRIGVHVQAGTVSTQEECEILIAVDQDTGWDGTASATTDSIYNMNTLCGATSRCRSRSVFTDTFTTTGDPVLDIELARKVLEWDVTGTGAIGMDVDLVYEPKNPPIINGPAMLIIYWGGDNAVVGGFADIQWLEFPESAFAL